MRADEVMQTEGRPTAQILDGRRIAQELRAEVTARVARLTSVTGTVPGLATVLVGDDPASEVYVANKRRLAVQVGLQDIHRRLASDADPHQVGATIDELAADDAVTGILLQLPLPHGLDAAELIDRIPVHKDVDGLTTASAGLLARGQEGLRPCTPSGVMHLLDTTGTHLRGLTATVVGRSDLVGRPMAQMLIERDVTVTVAHSRTRNLIDACRNADVLIAAAGVARLIGAEHVKDGAIVIDVGIHRSAAGLVGDVRHDEVAPLASWITPVPGGVGPMTIAQLLANTVEAAERSHQQPGG